MKHLLALFNKYWVRGWFYIGLFALFYEAIAVANETWGDGTLPTLSKLLVTTIPLPRLELLTVFVAVTLMWHWTQVKRG